MNDESIYVPGEWTCDACGFVVVKSVIIASTGDIMADASAHVEACPNDGTAMRQVTWREALTEARDIAGKDLIASQRMRAAVAKHHAQKADDRCILDDDELYAAFGLPPVDRRVGDKAAMLVNCQRFIERRCEAGGWPTYAELEATVAGLTAERDAARSALQMVSERWTFNNQQHTHTWHDWADCQPVLAAALAASKPEKT